MHTYGMIPSREDSRDRHLYEALPPRLLLPPEVDLRPQCSPVRDQGDLGACTAFAIGVGLREFLENKISEPFVPLSPLDLYYEERVREHSVNQDSGAQPRDGLKVLQKLGICPETDDPYNISEFTKAPSELAFNDAKHYRVVSYHRMNTLVEIKQCLASGYPVVLGIAVYSSFESNSAAQTGVIPLPSEYDSLLGYHAVLGVGYQDDRDRAIVRNSWGTTWGDKGYFYLPYSYFDPQRKLVTDMWTATL
jgi:C1A family cysteine protease